MLLRYDNLRRRISVLTLVRSACLGLDIVDHSKDVTCKSGNGPPSNKQRSEKKTKQVDTFFFFTFPLKKLDREGCNNDDDDGVGRDQE